MVDLASQTQEILGDEKANTGELDKAVGEDEPYSYVSSNTVFLLAKVEFEKPCSEEKREIDLARKAEHYIGLSDSMRSLTTLPRKRLWSSGLSGARKRSWPLMTSSSE